MTMHTDWNQNSGLQPDEPEVATAEFSTYVEGGWTDGLLMITPDGIDFGAPLCVKQFSWSEIEAIGYEWLGHPLWIRTEPDSVFRLVFTGKHQALRSLWQSAVEMWRAKDSTVKALYYGFVTNELDNTVVPQEAIAGPPHYLAKFSSSQTKYYEDLDYPSSPEFRKRFRLIDI